MLMGTRQKRRGTAGKPTAARVQPAGADVPLSSSLLLSTQHPHPSRHLPLAEFLAPPRAFSPAQQPSEALLAQPPPPALRPALRPSLPGVGPPRGSSARALSVARGGLPGPSSSPNTRGWRKER